MDLSLRRPRRVLFCSAALLLVAVNTAYMPTAEAEAPTVHSAAAEPGAQATRPTEALPADVPSPTVTPTPAPTSAPTPLPTIPFVLPTPSIPIVLPTTIPLPTIPGLPTTIPLPTIPVVLPTPVITLPTPLPTIPIILPTPVITLPTPTPPVIVIPTPPVITLPTPPGVPTSTPTPAPTDTPTPTATPSPTSTPTPTAIPSPTPEPTPNTDQTIYYGSCATCNTVTSSPGTTVTVNATGYQPNEVVTFVLHSDPVTLGTVPANAQGNVVNAVFTLPASAALGSHVLIGTGDSSGIAKVLGVTLAAVAATSSADSNLAATGYDSAAGLTQALVLLGIGSGVLAIALRRRRIGLHT